MAESIFAQAAREAQAKGAERAQTVKENVRKPGGVAEKVGSFFKKVRSVAETSGKFVAGTDVFVGALVKEGVEKGKELVHWDEMMEAGEKAWEKIDRWGERTADNIYAGIDALSSRYNKIRDGVSETSKKIASEAVGLGVAGVTGIESGLAEVIHGVPAFIAEVKRDHQQAAAERADSRADRAAQRAERRQAKIDNKLAEKVRKLEERAAAARNKSEERFIKQTEKHEAARDAARAKATEFADRASKKRQDQKNYGFFRRIVANL